MRVSQSLGGLLVLAMSVTACSGDDGSGDGSERADFAVDGTYTAALTSDPGNLHPLLAVQTSTNTVLAYAYDSLIHVTPDGEAVPRVAASWEVTPESVTFTLTEGVTCSDGTEVTPSVVAQTFEWVQDPENASPVAGLNLPSTDFTVEADDEAGTVTVTLPEPYGFLLEGAGLVPIVCPKGLADPSLLESATDGTGPFVLTDYAADDHLSLEARDGYTWGPDGASTDVPGFPARVEIRIVQNATTAVNLFLAGDLTEVTPTSAEQARLEGRDAFSIERELGPTDLFFNQRPGFPGEDPEVRRALTMALDLDQLAEVLTEGQGSRAEALAILPPRPCAANTVEGHVPEHDPEGAATLLDEAGWTMGDDGVRERDGERLTVTLGYLSGEDAMAAAMELVRSSWEDLGAEVNPQGQGANAYIGTLFGGTEWDAAFLSVGLLYPVQFTPFGSGPLPPEGQNFAAIDNADYVELSDQAQATPTNQGGCDLWGQAEQALFDNADVVPVATAVTVTYADRAEFAEGLSSLVEPTSIRLFSE